MVVKKDITRRKIMLEIKETFNREPKAPLHHSNTEKQLLDGLIREAQLIQRTTEVKNVKFVYPKNGLYGLL
jgi:hypothetical protein